MFAAVLLAAAPLIAFPSPDAKMPAVDHVYLIGSVRKGETNVVVQGASVPVYRTGAWATLVAVTPGSNTVSVVSAAGEATNLVFTVAAPPKADPSAPKPPEKVWEKLPYAKDEAKDPPTNRPPERITIVIDPGHGGTDRGALSPHGFFETDANLLVALRLRDELVSRGYRVVRTREDDSFPALYDRPKTAHACGADAFVSVHHNAPAYDRDPSELRYTAVYAWNPIGERLARSIESKLSAAFAGSPRSNGVLHANFAVTRNPEIPSCLVEVDFITSPEGEESIFDAARRSLTAKAVADGIVAWCAGGEGSQP